MSVVSKNCGGTIKILNTEYVVLTETLGIEILPKYNLVTFATLLTR
jgi:hypothetical protein